MPKTTEITPRRASEMVKPKELIEMAELVPLDLQDRRILNLLVKNAWHEIENETMHSIPKKDLRVGMGGATARLGQSIKRIMGVVVERRHGKNGIERFHLLTHNIDEDEDDDDALFRYTFPAPLRKIIRLSEVWARLESHVIYAFSSKYALALYELVALRCNLKHMTSETFELEKFRALIGVEPKMLRQFYHLKQRAIDYAVREVNGLVPDFNVAVNPVTTGRKVTAVEVSWWPKSKDEKRASLDELATSRVGRSARLAGTAERVIEPPKIEATAATKLSHSNPYNSNVSADALEEAARRLQGTGLDKYELLASWQRAVEKEGLSVKNPDRRFLHYVDGAIKKRKSA